MPSSSRRRFLERLAAAGGVASLVGVAGCSSVPDAGAPSSTAPPTGTPQMTTTERAGPTDDASASEDTPESVDVAPIDGSWESYRHDAANTAVTDDPGPGQKPAELWRTRTAIGRPATAPVAAAGLFVTATESGVPLALDATDGTIRWTGPRTVHPEVDPAGGDGTVVFAADSGVVGLAAESGAKRWETALGESVVGVAVRGGRAVVTTTGGVTALDVRSGAVRWRRGVSGTVTTPPAASDDTVAAGLDAGAVVAIAAESGNRRWRTPVGEPVEYAPAVGQGAVYAVAEGRLVALDRSDGTTTWRKSRPSGFATAPVVAGGRVYAVTMTEGADVTATGTPRPTDSVWFRAHVLAYTADGTREWQAEAKGTYGYHGPGPQAALQATKERVFAVLDGELLVYRAATGEELWSRPSRTVRPAVADGVISTGTTALAVSDGTERWTYQPSGGVNSAPAVVGNTVYVGSDDYHLYAVEANTGDVRWRTRTDGPVRTAPAVDESAVYVGTLEDTLYAIDRADGTVLWTFDAGGSVQSPTLANGTLYFGNFDAELLAVDAADGRERWRIERPRPFLARVPAVADGTVVAGSNGDLRAFDAADGTELWHLGFTEDMLVQSTPAIADGRVYLNVGRTLRAFALDDGSELWRARTGGSNGPPVVADGRIYATGGNRVYAFDTDGNEQWKRTVGESLQLVASADAIYAMGYDTPLVALDRADGSERWRDTTIEPTTTPVPAAESLFVGGDGGTLHALGTRNGS